MEVPELGEYTDRWKAIRTAPGEPLGLYDLQTDLGEEHDVAAEHPDVVARIDAHLKTARTPSTHWPLR
jgi:arylsulfatase A-like enzyme